MIRVLFGDLVALLAGHGVLRLAAGRWPVRAYGPVLAVCLSWFAGVAVVGALTVLVGVLGGRVTVLPFVGPAAAILAIVGLLPSGGTGAAARSDLDSAAPDTASGTDSASAGWRQWGVDAGFAVIGAVIAARTLLLGGRVPAVSNDEYAIWMLRGRALSGLGHLDPRVFLAADAGYPVLNYPLFLPAQVAWADGWAGRATDSGAHLAEAALLGAMLAVVGILVCRIAGPLPAVASVLLVAALPAVLSNQALRLMADVPTLTMSLPLVLVLLLWLRRPSRALLAAAAVLGAGAGGMKVEGLVFTVVAFAAAFALAPARRPVLLAGGAAVLANLPWLVYAQLHGLKSWIANGDTLTARHLRDVAPFTGHVLQGMAERWPGADSGLGAALLLGVLPAAVLAVRAGAGRSAAFLAAVVALDVLILAAQYVVSAYGPPSDPLAAALLEGQLRVTVFRITLLPAALLTIAVPVLAGLALPQREPASR